MNQIFLFNMTVYRKSDKPLTKDYGATTEVDKLSKEDLVRKLEMLESVLEK